jgi:muconolactone delta-isomerase
MNTHQSFQQAYTFLSQGIAAKLFRDNGHWTCVPMYNTKQTIELEMLK